MALFHSQAQHHMIIIKKKQRSEFVFNVQPTANVIWRLDNNENNDNYKKNSNGVRKN